jgi:enamine deaminase RidA (YjgF/YER057c/UK114 family)
MERRIVNPWTWQDQYGFVQAIDLHGPRRLLICAGQASTDSEGATAHPGDMRAQVAQALDNLETVLHRADLDFSDVVRLNYFTTDVDRFLAEAAEELGSRLAQAGCRPASTLVGVARLAYPDLLIEIEATAVA